MLIPFDILYEGFCNRVRSSGKSEAILQLMKTKNNSKFRVKALLEEEPDLYSLLERNVGDSFDKKDEVKARKFAERGREGKSLELLTEALSFCPLPSSFEEVVLKQFEPENHKSLLKKFMESPLKENSEDFSDNLISQIFYDRGNVLFGRKQYTHAFKDFLHAWLLGYAKTLEMSYRVAVCFFENGNLEESKEILQCSAQHLRAIPMSNEGKSEWTMSIVKVLKTIEGIRKHNPKKVTKDSCQILSQPSKNEELEIFSELFSGESANITYTSAMVELKHSQEKGRHMVAKANIPPGSTVIAENPYAWAVSKANYYKFCTWCIRRVYTGIPCDSCASAVFCNAKCRKQAMDSFHGKECKVMKLVDSSQKLGNMAHLCFRTLLITPISTLQEYLKYCDCDDETSIPHQVTMGLNDDGKLESSNYLSVFSQTPNSEQRSAADLLKRTFSAIYLTLCLKYTGYFKGETGESSSEMSEIEVGVAALFLRHLQGASCNAYGLNYIEKKSNYATEEEDYKKNLEISEIGGATYPVISTTNHSCNPNCYRINIPGKMCLVKTLREIGEGEEIFDCYGPLYLTEARQERISRLQTQYLFRCNCPPCAENWPPYGKLRTMPVRRKCSSCGCELKADGKNSNSKIKCPYCDKVTDMKKSGSNLLALKERFTTVKTSILGEAFQPFDKDMEAIICQYIQACQGSYLDPCIDSVEAQEFLKLFWNVSIRNS